MAEPANPVMNAPPGIEQTIYATPVAIMDVQVSNDYIIIQQSGQGNSPLYTVSLEGVIERGPGVINSFVCYEPNNLPVYTIDKTLIPDKTKVSGTNYGNHIFTSSGGMANWQG